MPMTPIGLSRQESTAAFAPGSITPMTGMDKRWRKKSSATAEAVLQAATISLTLYFSRKKESCKANCLTTGSDLVP